MWCARVFVFIILCALYTSAKRFDTRCKLVREVLKVGIANDIFLGQWVCLIEKVSNRDTSALVVSPSGKKSYGLYQIPDRWCKEGKRGGDCNLACEFLLDDDIRDDTECAIQIFNREGFKYWSRWNTRCKNDIHITTEIYKCPELSLRRGGTERLTTSEHLKHRRRLTRPVGRSAKETYRTVITDTALKNKFIKRLQWLSHLEKMRHGRDNDEDYMRRLPTQRQQEFERLEALERCLYRTGTGNQINMT